MESARVNTRHLLRGGSEWLGVVRDEIFQKWIVGEDLLNRESEADSSLETLNRELLIPEQQRHDNALVTGSRRST